MKTHMNRNNLLLLGVVTLFALALSLLSGAPADAYTHSASGQPGNMTTPKALGSHVTVDCGVPGYQCYLPWVIGQGPVVYRSPATTGNQIITLVYTFERWNSSTSRWVVAAQPNFQRTLQAGYNSIQMPRGDYTPNGNGYFRVHTSVGWGNSNGLFGSRHLRYVDAGDYACRTNFARGCDASSGYVYLRGGP